MRAGARASEEYQREVGRIDWPAVLSGAIVAFVISLVASGLLGVVMLRSSLSDSIIPGLMAAVGYVSIALGGLYTGYRTEQLGWLNGGMAAVVYVLASFLVGLILFPGVAAAWPLVKRAAVGFAVGAFGGTMGINMQ